MWTPVRRRSVSDEVFDQLKERIVRGEMSPGAALPSERALAEMLGVNRGALREALKRLEQASLVSIQHGGATRVANFIETASLDLLGEMLFTPDGALQPVVARSIMEMRSALAPDVVRLAAMRATDDERDAIDAIVEEMAANKDDVGALQLLAMDFWRAAVVASKNIAYRLAHNSLHATYERLSELLTQVLADELKDIASYRAIAKAIRRGDTSAAEKRAQTLMQRGSDQILAVVDAISAHNNGD